MAEDFDKAQWVRRALGVTIAGVAPPTGPVLPIWAEAKDAVDAGLDKLQAALHETGDPDLVQIAEFGLNGATDRQSVRLMAALRDMDAASTPQAREKLAAAVEAFQTFLDGDRVVALIEDNPFGIAVPLRSRLSAALDKIAAIAAA
jgi:hypothetical protein